MKALAILLVTENHPLTFQETPQIADSAETNVVWDKYVNLDYVKQALKTRIATESPLIYPMTPQTAGNVEKSAP